MNSVNIQWFLLGAAALGAVWSISRLLYSHTESSEKLNSGSPHNERQNLEQPRLSSQQEPRTTVETQPPSISVPYNLDKRPMPEGDNIDRLLPRQIGKFQRGEPRGDIHDVMYIEYSDGRIEICLSLAICNSPEDAQSGVDTARLESADVTESVEASSIGTEPSFHKTRFNNPRMGTTGKGTGITWNRGRYYFSADARTDEILNQFMENFPY